MDRKVWSDAVWGYGAFGAQAFVGLSVNLLLLGLSGAQALGVYATLYAIFAVGGQLVVLGLTDSVIKHVAERERSSGERDAIGLAAVILAIGAGLIGGLALASGSGLVGTIVDDSDVARGMLWLAPGLSLFVVNKVLLGVLNGRRRMAELAIGQAIRAGMILLVCVGVVFSNAPVDRLGLCFTLAEVAVLGWALYTRPLDSLRCGWRQVFSWLRPHLSFGARALPNAFLSEAFVRIDVLMLGVFLSAAEVGIYSFAAFFFEGLYAVAMVWRHLANPVLARLLASGDQPALRAFVGRTSLASLLLTGSVAGVLLAVFPFFSLVASAEVVAASRQPMWILAAGMTAYAIVVPFEHVLLQAGRPGLQSVVMTFAAVLNVALNALLIPRMGLMGAAWSTSLSFLSVGVVLAVFCWALLRWRDERVALVVAGELTPPLEPGRDPPGR